MDQGLNWDMPELEYRKFAALNASTLKHFRRSALHAWQALSQPSSPTSAMILGTAVHLALLEPYRYIMEHAIGPTGDRRTNKWKEWAAEAPQPLKLTPDEALTVEKIQSNFDAGASPEGTKLLREGNGRSEATAIWMDPELGVMCKARADRICSYQDEPVIVELKTARDASPHGFRSAIRQYQYDIAAAWYLRGFGLVGKTEPRRLIFVVVETEPPYAIALYTINALRLDAALAEAMIYGKQYADSQRTHVWPGYQNQPLELLP